MSSKNHESSSTDFIVDRHDLRRARFVPSAESTSVLEPGQALLRVAKFAFTSNNVTYGVVGDMMSYWQFFPAEKDWGRIPVWGFGEVVRSNHGGVAEGERFYGYFPMSSHLVVQAAGVDRGGFVDATPHRAGLPAVYNRYARTATDPGHVADYEDQQMLLRPLFLTAFLLEKFLSDHDFFGARTVVLSSASSKTAIGLAFLLSENRRDGLEVVGLTSPSNVPFVERLGYYDRVLAYDRIESLPRDRAVAFVDMAGNGRVVSALHNHLKDQVKHNSIVGMTHWETAEREESLPGAAPAFFFAPTHVEQCVEEWGADGLQERTAAASLKFLKSTDDWLVLVRGYGKSAVEAVYQSTLEGRSDPAEGHVLSLWAKDGASIQG